jgi:hypothetical protein
MKAGKLRDAVRIENGFHPIGIRLGPLGESCGTCAHLQRREHSGGKYFKCALRPKTKGPGTDIRMKWPACAFWKGAGQ